MWWSEEQVNQKNECLGENNPSLLGPDSLYLCTFVWHGTLKCLFTKKYALFRQCIVWNEPAFYIKCSTERFWILSVEQTDIT